MYEAELIAAVRNNNADEVKRLLGLKADPNALDSGGWSALVNAAYDGFTTLIDLLLKAGAKVDQSTNDGLTPLWVASQEGQVDVIERLLKAGAKVDQPDKNSATPLYVASQKGHVDAIDRLLKAGAAVDQPMNDGATPLYVASQNGHVNAIDRLLKAGAKVDQSNTNGATPLFMASHGGHVDAIDRLLKAGAQVDKPNTNGATPLWIACQNGHVDVIERLLKAGAKVNQPRDNGATPLLIASHNGHINAVDRLLQAGAKVNQPNTNGATPLWIACQNGHVDVIERLLKAGAKVNQPRDNGATPLLIASHNGHINAVDRLLQAGADLTIQVTGKDALSLAKEKNHLEIVALIEAEIARRKALAEKPKASIEKPLAKLTMEEASASRSFTLIPYKDISFSGRVLGEGGFGVVKQAAWQHTEVAVKQLKAMHLSESSLQEFQAEAQNHAKLKHPNVVMLYGVCVEPGKYCMVMELMLGASLYDLLHNGQDLPWTLRLSIAKDITAGLAYLHAQKIIHRDLKSMNVLLDSNMRAKLSDFGLAKVKHETNSTTTAAKSVGTLCWMAPELLQLRPSFSQASDIYALGIVFWELASRELPYKGTEPTVVRSCVREGEREEIPASTPKSFTSLIAQCWAQRAEARPRASDVITLLPASQNQGSANTAPVMPSSGYQAFSR